MIATIAYQDGLITLALFSVVVGIGVITTTLSPIMARLAIARELAHRHAQKQAEPLEAAVLRTS